MHFRQLPRPVVFKIEQLRQACATFNHLARRRLTQLKEFCSEIPHHTAAPGEGRMASSRIRASAILAPT
jgi:hypothetical protein